MSKAIAILALSAAVLVAFPSAAHADMRITGTNDPRYPLWRVVPDNTVFQLGPGCVVEILNLQTLKVRIFKGPSLPRPRQPLSGRQLEPEKKEGGAVPLSCS
jgi:hypothetical protein